MTTSSGSNAVGPWPVRVALAPFVVMALVLLGATAFTFPQTDDFCTFGRVLIRYGGNPLPDLMSTYGGWTGRYSSTLLIGLVGASSSLIPVPISYPLALAGFVVLFLFACRQVSRLPSARNRPDLPLALAIFCGVLVVMPSKLEQFFWLTGAVVYFVGPSVLLLLIHAIAGNEESRRESTGREAWIAILIVAVTGFNELIALVLGACLAWSCIDALLQRRATWRHAARLLLFAAAFAITTLAPGNFLRDAGSQMARHDIIAAAGLVRVSLAGLESTYGIALPAALAVLAALSAGAGWTRGEARPARAWLPYLAILVLSLPAQLWVYSFLTGEPSPGRILNQAITLAMVGACVAAAYAGHRLASRLPAASARWLHLAGLTVTGLGLAMTPNFANLARTVTAFGPSWHAQQLQRHTGLSAITATTLPVYVKPFEGPDGDPPVYRGGDVGPDPKHWINRCVAGYYQIPAIIQMRRTRY